MAHEKTSPKTPTSLFPDDDEAVMVRQNEARTNLQIDPKCFQQVATEFLKLYLTEFSAN